MAKNEGGDKVYNIFVNTKKTEWSKDEISYNEVVILRYGSISTDENVSYSVTYTRGHDTKHEGSMVKGDIVSVKSGMRFDVTQTNKS
jgi:hypothetical protein